jgi:hypothetical protein
VAGGVTGVVGVVGVLGELGVLGSVGFVLPLGDGLVRGGSVASLTAGTVMRMGGNVSK